MEAKACMSETEAEPMVSDHPAGFHEIKLEDYIGKGSFEEWISLISRIEKTYSDDIERIRLAYDSFLSEFPLCHGYWRRYADHMIRLSSVDEVVEVFERAVQSATYSVGVWVDYCTFSMLVFENPDDTRRLFKTGLSYVGKDYLCHELWDQYIKFELSQEQWSLLAYIYIEALRFPTKKLHIYYDGFKKLTSICNKDMSGNCNADSLLGSTHDVEVPKSYTGHNISSVVKDLFEPSISIARSKTLLLKYLSIGEHLYHEATQLDEKICRFEAKIQRSYFHVKSLDVDQLENWHHYLDFVEMQGDFDWVAKLYERCLIPCANYPEFWMRYVEFMETKGGREIANYALHRATQVFFKRVPMIHLFNSRFKEHQGDVIGARLALDCDDESDSEFVENVVIKANMERRLGNFMEASNIFENALLMAAKKKKLDILPSLYIHFSRLKQMIAHSSDDARDILIDGIKHLPNSKLLLEELINFATLNGGQRHLQAVDSIIDNLLSPGPDVSQHLKDKDAEDISSLYLKFVDLCGTIHQVRKSWNRHIRRFPHSIRTSLNEHQKYFELATGGREDAVVTQPHQPSENGSPNHLVQLPLQEEKISTHDSISGHDLPCCMSQDDPAIQYKQAPTKSEEAFQSGESDHAAMEIVEFPSFKVPEQSRNASAEINVPSVGLGASKCLEQSREDTAECQVTEGTKSEQAIKGHSNGDDFQQDYDHDPQQDTKSDQNYDHEPRQDMKSQQDYEHGPQQEMKSLSLDLTQDNSPHNLHSFMHFPSEAPKETCNFGRSNMETEPQSKGDSSISQGKTNTSDSPRTEIEVVNLSSSRSHPSPTLTEQPPHPHTPTNSITGGNHQTSDPSSIHRESKFGPRGHVDRKSHQQQQVSPQHQRVKLGGPMPMNQGHAFPIASLHSPQIQRGSRAQQPYQAAPPIKSTTPTPPNPAWPLHQSNCASLRQPTQGSGEHGIQNTQSYNQMWQYYYYQQQLSMQQQNFAPPPYQQPQLQQQHYNHQQLQFQSYQQPHHQQHFYQQQRQLFTHSVIQQPTQEQQLAEQRQYQLENSQPKIQEPGHSHFRQDASVDHNVANQSALEPVTQVLASKEQVTSPSPRSPPAK